MAAAQAGQAVVPRRLYAQRKAVHTGPAERGQSLGRDGLGVGFERDLRTGRRPGGADETGRLRGRQQRGRAAAEIERVGGARRGAARRKTVHFPAQASMYARYTVRAWVE